MREWFEDNFEIVPRHWITDIFATEAFGNPLTLGQVIECYAALPGSNTVKYTLTKEHSYRGYYYRLAFDINAAMSKVADNLQLLESCVGRTFQGYKGGKYIMVMDTICYISEYGRLGQPLTLPLLNFILSSNE